MNPETIQMVITLLAQLAQFLLDAKANGQLTDAALDAAIAGQNSDTRALIKQFLGQ